MSNKIREEKKNEETREQTRDHAEDGQGPTTDIAKAEGAEGSKRADDVGTAATQAPNARAGQNVSTYDAQLLELLRGQAVMNERLLRAVADQRLRDDGGHAFEKPRTVFPSDFAMIKDDSDVRKIDSITVSEGSGGLTVNLNLGQGANYVNTVNGYVEYQSLDLPGVENTDELMSTADGVILKETIAKMGMNKALVLLEYHPELLRKAEAATSQAQVPMSQDLLHRNSDILRSTDYYRYVIGKLQLIVCVAFDRDVMLKNDTDTTAGSDVSKRLLNMLGSKIQRDVGANPALLQAVATTPKWLYDHIKAVMEEVTYVVGEVDKTMDQTSNVISLLTYARNIDQFKAEILNRNLLNVIRNQPTTAEIEADLLSCALANSVIHVGPKNEFVLIDKQRRDVNDRAMLAGLMMRDELVNEILRYNIDALSQFGVINMYPAYMLYDRSQEGGLTQTRFRTNLDRAAGQVDYTKILRMMAEELTPMVFHNTLKASYSMRATDEVGLLQLFVWLLNFWFRPNRMAANIYALQEHMLTFISKWIPHEYTPFIQKYGTSYTIVNGQQVFDRTEDVLTNVNYSTDRYPSLFAKIKFERCPQIVRMMELMEPIGELVEDNISPTSAFPRFDRRGYHYIPYRPVAQGKTDHVRARYRMFVTFVMDLIKQQNETMPKDVAYEVKTWLNWSVERMISVVEQYNRIASVMRVVASTPVNVMCNFNGDYSKYKPTNYVFSGTRTSRTLIRHAGNVSNQMAIYDLNDVLAIFGGLVSDSDSMRGNGEISFKHDRMTTPPSPPLLLLPANAIVNNHVNFASMIGLMSLITTPEGQAQIPELRTLMHDWPNVSDAQYRILLEAFRGLTGNHESGKLLNDAATIILESVGTMNQPINLGAITVKRRNHLDMVDLNPDEDNPSFMDLNWFMDTSQLDRLKIGVNLIENRRLQNVRKGIRVVKIQKRVLSIADRASTYGYELHEYNRATFVSEYVGHQSIIVLYLARYGKVERFDNLNEYPTKIRMRIDNPTEVPSNVINILSNAISARDWMVDLPNSMYVVRFHINVNTAQELTFEQLMTSNEGTVHVMDRVETISWDYMMPTALPRAFMMFVNIYPIDEIINNVSIRATTINRTPNTGPGYDALHIEPRVYEMDTGDLSDAQGVVLYSDGTPKLSNRSEISMTNKVLQLRANVNVAGTMWFEYKPPSRYPYDSPTMYQ